MALQGNSLWMTALGLAAPDQIEEGVHVRWSVSASVGFPPLGFDLYRRRHVPSPVFCMAMGDTIEDTTHFSSGDLAVDSDLPLNWRLQQAARSTSRPPGPYRDAEGDLFDHLLYDLLGSPTRAVPPRPQATGFGDAAAPAAVLVELPEPAEWDRLTWSVATGAQALSVAVVRDAAGLRALPIRPGPRSATVPAPWTAGRYDLTLGYLLDTGQDDLPVLSRGGSPAPEEPPPVQLRIGSPGITPVRDRPGA